MTTSLLIALQKQVPVAVPVPPKTPTPPPPKIFSLSGISSDVDKKRYFAAIKNLGATFIDSIQFEAGCTHLVIKSPNRNEKFLAFCAAGKWVLSIDFLEDSIKAGHFLPVRNEFIMPDFFTVHDFRI